MKMIKVAYYDDVAEERKEAFILTHQYMELREGLVCARLQVDINLFLSMDPVDFDDALSVLRMGNYIVIK